MKYAPETCRSGTDSCRFKVILIGQRFIYLQPVKAEDATEQQSLYAVPISDVEWMTYASEGSGA